MISEGHSEASAVSIDGRWRQGKGPELTSGNPADGRTVWSAGQATAGDVADALASSRSAQPSWDHTPLNEREAVLRRFEELVNENKEEFAVLISSETGKPLWEAATEVAAVAGKVALSIEAYKDRTPSVEFSETARLSHRPLGVMGVLGPFNFPAHLPNGQIVPALLAGNAVVYKPSELTPAVAQFHVDLLQKAGLPPGILNLVIGGRDVGAALVDGAVDGIAFTGSVATGRALHRALADRPNVLLALEMGGNNPLVASSWDDLGAAVNTIIRSAFLTAGQRCTCARRLYIPSSVEGDDLLEALVNTTMRLRVGAYDDNPPPFLGPVVSAAAAASIRASITDLVASGATALTGPGEPIPGTGFVRPTILDADHVAIPDEEIFGPVLTVQRFEHLHEVFGRATATDFGLAAGLLSTSAEEFQEFQQTVRAGVINWNTPTTGASGRLPFGGVGASGNHRPAGWTAADFCSYPVAMVTYASVTDSDSPLPGLANEIQGGAL
ncbi:MAG: succinylglutamate-semialdehyde dehydrogenase [Acidimicrobiales bacterium]|nr:succinylglutamate-semialdehyde dehydrogenase [Acidimicrobiales bacterium]